MRRSVYLGFFMFVFAALAGQLPLTVSEIGLMLRSGYSSSAVMQELSKRHFADGIDETKEAKLVKDGASVELIASLKSGAYSLSPEKTAAIQQEIANQEQRRVQQAEAIRKSDTAYQEQLIRQRSAKPTAAGPDVNVGMISEFLKGDLVQLRNGESAPVDDAAM